MFCQSAEDSWLGSRYSWRIHAYTVLSCRHVLKVVVMWRGRLCRVRPTGSFAYA
jgi:hypothetical protein